MTDDDIHEDVSAASEARVQTIPGRGDRRTYQTTSGDFEIELLSRFGLDLEEVITDQLADLEAARRVSAGPDADLEAASDRVIWLLDPEGEVRTVAAVIRPRAEGPAEVTRFES